MSSVVKTPKAQTWCLSPFFRKKLERSEATHPNASHKPQRQRARKQRAVPIQLYQKAKATCSGLEGLHLCIPSVASSLQPEYGRFRAN